MNTKYFILSTKLLFGTISLVYAQEPVLQKGGLAYGKTIVLTGSKTENAINATKPASSISYLNYTDTGVKVQFAPQLPKPLNWVAMFNTPAKNTKSNYFLYDGWLAATSRIATNHRLRRFEEDITNKISSNAYHMAFKRIQLVENEVFMLVISPKKQKVIIQLNKQEFGVQRILEYDMNELEAKFIHIVVPPKEYSVTTWRPELTERTMQPITQWQFILDTKNELNERNSWQGKKVTVPHTWNATDIFDTRNFKDSLNIMQLYARGNGWYKTSFFVPSASDAYKYELNFLGANQVTEAWLNGKYLGKHIGGYTGFRFPLQNAIQYNKANTLLVKVDNSYNFDIPPHTADYNFLGGIYREVYLEKIPTNNILKTKITTPDVSYTKATIHLATSFVNTNARVQKLVINLVNPYNEIIKSWVQNTPATTNELKIQDSISQPILWHPENPALYKVYTTLYGANDVPLDQTVENIGFRFFKFTPNDGFILNGKPLKLKGVNVHQDYLNQGWATDSSRKRADYLWMKKMGVNYVRMSHYPKHPYELFLCDSLGFVVWEEIPVVNTVGREAFIENAKQMMKEMIDRDFNRPSLIFLGVGNEYYRNFFTAEDAKYALECTKQVAAICKQLNPERLTIQAQNDLVDERIMALTDIQGRNRYFGWYEKTYNNFEEEMELEHSKHPTWRLLVSEYGAEGKYAYHVDSPKIFDHSETYQVNFHKAYWNTISKHKYIAGGTIWNMFDFASFAKIGNGPHINKKGMLTYDRKPKDVFYYYQSVWTDDLMARIAGHTYTHRTLDKNNSVPVEVFSNAEEVELIINGKSFGKKMAQEGFTWQCNLTEGSYQVKVVAHKHGQVVIDKCSFYVASKHNTNNLQGVGNLQGDGF